MTSNNPVGLKGFEFIEFSASNPQGLHDLFLKLGFSRIKRHKTKNIDYYKQNDIHFLLNKEPGSFAQRFSKEHGPCAASTGWRVQDAKEAQKGEAMPAIKGVGDSLIYFIDNADDPNRYEKMGFVDIEKPDIVESKGFALVDHLTNNVFPGELEPLSKFYKDVFGFEEIRHFDIRGKKTGLLSYALRSPCGSFCIPINEGTESKSQINEYLREYHGQGIQHIALLTGNLIKSMEKLAPSGLKTLDMDNDYYEEVFQRVPNVTEDHDKIKKMNLLVDGDEHGYLVQIFTENVIGPIFFEFIQRKNHYGFGEGNFGALFRAIERDQEKRGVL
jgi:4-hydroxyphenylpyruvate dioxygenase